MRGVVAHPDAGRVAVHVPEDALVTAVRDADRPTGAQRQEAGVHLEADVLASAECATDAAGAFAIVVEGVAADLAGEITAAVKAPTIGIGASATCDGQILVTDDMLGLFDWTPKFVRRYADLRTAVSGAVSGYAADVRARKFPSEAETYALGAKRRVAGAGDAE
jgi:3-methyl-2-oxobutanoate hydroxymethyltransferase